MPITFPRILLAITISCLGLAALAQELTADPETLVDTLASANRPPMQIWLSAEARRDWQDFVEQYRTLVRQRGHELSEQDYRLLEEVLPVGLLDELCPGNPLSRPFNTEAQERVRQAERELKRRGVTAFPALLLHWNDKRYSQTDRLFESSLSLVMRNGGLAKINLSVGDVCRRLLVTHLNAPGHYKGNANYIPDCIPPNRVPDWWSSRSTFSLKDLKREALVWTIAEEKRRADQGDGRAKERAERLETELAAAGAGRPRHASN